jgi:kynurenine formamidase
MTQSIRDALHGALTDETIQVLDLSVPLNGRTPMIDLPQPFAQAPGFSLNPLCEYDEYGPSWHWNSFTGSEHMGTHLDAPIHWITGRDGEDVSEIAPRRLLGPIVVIDRAEQAASDPDYLLTVEDVREIEPLPDGAWLFMRTGWSARHSDPETFLNESHWPGVGVECARYIAEHTPLRGYGCEQVGIDAGVAHSFDPIFPMHHYLLGAGKYGLASLGDLSGLPDVGAMLIAAPLRIEGGSGSPTRAYALVPA